MSLQKVRNILVNAISASTSHFTVVGVNAIPSVALGLVIFATNSYSTTAQIPGSQIIKNQTTSDQVNILFVNPSIGNDTTGNGTKNAPWRTITQALAMSTPNTIIMLAAGTYKTNSGEIFPLILKPGVAIEGNIANRGKSVVINGGGQYLSRSFGGQNVAIVANNQSGISGVTIINNNSRGYGLWTESSNTIVKANTFTQNTQDGIAVTGNGSGSISNNYFYRNGANGITISGNARPEIRENVFQQTGFGINIAQNATPLIVNNQILSNRSGIIVQANASPILRNNVIQSNREDGLVVIAQGQPDLGSGNDPGRNSFKNNKRYDINAKAGKLVIFASGNNLANNRIKGKVNLSGNNIAKTKFPSPQPVENNLPVRQVSQVRNNRILPPLPNSVRNVNLQEEVELSPISETEDHSAGIEFVAPQLDRQLNKVEKVNSSRLGDLKPLPKVIKNQSSQTYQNTYPTVINSQRVQTFQPYHNTYPTVINSQRVQTFQSYGVGGQIPRYRVLVLVNNQQQISLVSDLAKDAFPRVWRGQRVMQIAVFTNSNNARSMIMNLANRGLQAVIEPVN